MSKRDDDSSADLDVGMTTAERRRRRRRGALRVPSDNVPRRAQTSPPVVAPVPEDPALAMSIAYSFTNEASQPVVRQDDDVVSDGHGSAETEALSDGGSGSTFRDLSPIAPDPVPTLIDPPVPGDASEVESVDFETKTREMAAVDLEALGLATLEPRTDVREALEPAADDLPSIIVDDGTAHTGADGAVPEPARDGADMHVSARADTAVSDLADSAERAGSTDPALTAAGPDLDAGGPPVPPPLQAPHRDSDIDISIGEPVPTPPPRPARAHASPGDASSPAISLSEDDLEATSIAAIPVPSAAGAGGPSGALGPAATAHAGHASHLAPAPHAAHAPHAPPTTQGPQAAAPITPVSLEATRTQPISLSDVDIVRTTGETHAEAASDGEIEVDVDVGNESDRMQAASVTPAQPPSVASVQPPPQTAKADAPQPPPLPDRPRTPPAPPPKKPPPPVAAQQPAAPPPAPPAAAAAPAPPPKDKVARGKPWFVDLFDEDYLRTLPFLTAQATQAEAEFVIDAMNLQPGAQLLDVGCGYGRHAMELAARGYHVVGLDMSTPLLVRGGEEAHRRGLTINFVRGDMRELDFDSQFDGAYCLFSTFGYFDDETNKKALANIARALRPGGRVLIEILNRDYVIADLPTRVWWEGEGCVVLEEVELNYFSSRIQVNRSVVFDDGRQVEQEISIRAYALHEVGKLMHAAGFRVLEVSGAFQTRGRFFGNQSRHIIVLAERKDTSTLS